jgi:LPXTG-site transpeptidase (sortase) family protein
MRAAGWHEGSAALGVPGNTVLNGHNAGHGEVFRNLYKLEAGDPVIVYSGETPYLYAVSQVLLLQEVDQPLQVRRRNARYIEPTADDRLTLVTCHPYASLRYRLIVIARPDPGGSGRPSRRTPRAH